MSDESKTVTRRSVLRATVGAASTAGVTGLAAGAARGRGTDLATFNVGYDAESGRQAALAAAAAVKYDHSFDALSVRASPEAMAGLDERADVRYVERSEPLTLHAQTLPWGVDRIDADRTPADVDAAGIDVAILDTGIDSDHPDLAANLGDGEYFGEDGDGCFTLGCGEPWGDDEGHGTAVAGIVGAIDDDSHVVGVAPDVTLHSAQVCDSTNSCESAEVMAGLDWVAQQGYEVANMSFGIAESSGVEDAIESAADDDVLMVASAGNDGGAVGFPANHHEVVAVSAVTESLALRFDSNTGPEIDLAAPGDDVETTALGGGTGSFGGTSAAAPHVAGTAALARSLVDSREQAVQLLFDKAEDVGLSTDEQGHGLVDAGAVTTEPWVVTDPATDVTDSGAILHGELHTVRGASSVDVFFEVDGPTTFTTDPETLTQPGTFSEAVSGLESSTTYSVRAHAKGSDGDDGVGDWELFVTDGGSF